MLSNKWCKSAWNFGAKARIPRAWGGGLGCEGIFATDRGVWDSLSPLFLQRFPSPPSWRGTHYSLPTTPPSLSPFGPHAEAIWALPIPFLVIPTSKYPQTPLIDRRARRTPGLEPGTNDAAIPPMIIPGTYTAADIDNSN